ncbi:MAG: hypothetical protein HCAMLNBO_00226 [Candidatus Brocadia fulgida]|nr:hypothetical protein [Candidatus Brocadia fulgida]
MRTPEALYLVSLDLLRPCPALGRTQHDHRPPRTEGVVRFPRLFLLGTDLADGLFQRGSHLFMHFHGVASLHKIGLVAVADKQRLQLLVADPRKNCWVGDLVTIEVQDRQHHSVAHRVDKLVGMPRGSKRSGLRLAVTHHAGDDEIGVIERHAIGMGEAVAELSAFMDGTGSFRGDVAPDMAGEGELLEKFLHPFRILALVRIDLGVGAFEIRRSQHPWCAMAGSGNEDRVEVVLDDHPVHMHPNKG